MKPRKLLQLFSFLVAYSGYLTRAGSITAALNLSDLTLSTATTYTFTITAMDNVLIADSHFIFEFDSTLGVTIPNSLSSCVGVLGFTTSSVPCIKESSNRIRLNCYTCDLSSHPNYEIRIVGIINPAFSLPSSADVNIYTYDQD